MSNNTTEQPAITTLETAYCREYRRQWIRDIVVTVIMFTSVIVMFVTMRPHDRQRETEPRQNHHMISQVDRAIELCRQGQVSLFHRDRTFNAQILAANTEVDSEHHELLRWRNLYCSGHQSEAICRYVPERPPRIQELHLPGVADSRFRREP